MNRSHLFLTSVLVLGLAVVVAPDGDAQAARGEVICKFKKVGGKKRISCPKGQLQGKRGKRGKRGAAGAAGPTGPPGATGATGAGSNLNLNFNANLNANELHQIVVGNFTVRAASGPTGACVDIVLRAGNTDSRVSKGPAGTFALLPNNEATTLQAGNTSNMFTAVSDNGGSTVSGIVGRVTVGARCLVSGYVTGV